MLLREDSQNKTDTIGVSRREDNMPDAIQRPKTAKLPTVALAVSVGETEIAGALISSSGRLMAEKLEPVKHKTVKSTVEATGKIIVDLATQSVRERYELKSIGIALDGNIDPESDRITFRGRSGFNWSRVPFRELVEEVLENSGVDIRYPVTASPVRAARKSSAHPLIGLCPVGVARALAESWLGAAEGSRNVFFLSLDSSISCGLVLDGRPLNFWNQVGETISWMPVGGEFAEEYAAHGSLGYHLSESALIRKTIEKWTPEISSPLGNLVNTNPGGISTATIIRAARGGDALAMSVVEEACELVGKTIASVIALVGPEAVVLDGSFAQLMKPFLSSIKQATRRWSQPVAIRNCTTSISKLGNQGVLLGAARMAFNLANANQEG